MSFLILFLTLFFGFIIFGLTRRQEREDDCNFENKITHKCFYQSQCSSKKKLSWDVESAETYLRNRVARIIDFHVFISLYLLFHISLCIRTQTTRVLSAVNAIMKIKGFYQVKKNWIGDPCVPQDLPWEGLNCSYNDRQNPRIVSL